MANEDFNDKVRRVFWMHKEAKALEAKADELLDSLGALETHNYAAGDFILQVTPTKRFDPATAKRALTAEQFASILATKPDSATAKSVLPPNVYAQTQRTYGQTRKIVLVDDLED